MALVSMRMTPNSATNKLESAPDGYGVKIPVAAGTSVDVTVWVRKSDSSDSANNTAVYNGSQPRLIQRANAALGQSLDVVLATATDTPGVAIAPTTWDISSADMMSLSNGDLTITNTQNATADQGVHAPNSAGQSTGKFYFEIKYIFIPAAQGVNAAGDDSFGVGALGTTYASITTSGIGGAVVLCNGGGMYGAGSYYGATLSPFLVNDLCCFAIDLTNRRVWFRKSPTGLWNNSGTADPANNIGGFVLGAGIMIPYITGGGGGAIAGGQRTANFGQSAFAGAVPAGFNAGWLVTTITNNWVQLTGTSSVATDDGVWEFVIDCDGTVGWVNVDDWNFVGVATTANGMKNWYQGVPITGGGGGGGGYFQGGFL